MRGFDQLAQKDVEQYSLAVQSQLEGMQDKAREAAYAVAGRPDVAEAVKRGDTAYIQKMGKRSLRAVPSTCSPSPARTARWPAAGTRTRPATACSAR